MDERIQMTKNPRAAVTYCHSSSSVAFPKKKKHWKEGEYPGFTEQDKSKKRIPIKNIKKKLDRKSNAKTWVNTVTEALSDHIDRKEWVQALRVGCF
ncbi:Pentatricopeptide repeat-containing protein, chloroplastic [Capsicum baccatum]|uniref:Pentatricopeptide repeat-containing protein, chloroplastic n=1 Tax=Capsicum baccatum TaxID=33114 RepID=A0A2G2VTJ9_CAPBA|nr:Pentatricopeptide repeat-containing protein, chloroplastic [Capsicum baccatum]